MINKHLKQDTILLFYQPEKSMQKLNLITSLILVIAGFCSCSSTEDVVTRTPYVANLCNTDCLSVPESDGIETYSKESVSSFEMNFEGTSANCNFISLDYPCDFDKVNIIVTYSYGTMIIVEYPSSDMADCRCETDASFTIENIPENDFLLKIYHGNPSGDFDELNPKFSGRIVIANGGIKTPY